MVDVVPVNLVKYVPLVTRANDSTRREISESPLVATYGLSEYRRKTIREHQDYVLGKRN